MQTDLHALRNVVCGSQSPQYLPKIRGGLPSTQDRLHMTGLVSVHRPCFAPRWAGALSLPSAPTAGGGGGCTWAPLAWKLPPKSAGGPTLSILFPGSPPQRSWLLPLKTLLSSSSITHFIPNTPLLRSYRQVFFSMNLNQCDRKRRHNLSGKTKQNKNKMRPADEGAGCSLPSCCWLYGGTAGETVRLATGSQ